MEWLALSIILLGIIYFAIQYSGFRRFLAYTAGALAALVAIGAAYFWYDNRQSAAKRQSASLLISVDQIDLTDTTLSFDSYSPKFTGTVLNKSAYPLAELRVRIIVSDCPGMFDDLIDDLHRNLPRCITVAEDTVSIHLSVPATQKRAFSEYVPNSLTRYPKINGYKNIRFIVQQTIAEF